MSARRVDMPTGEGVPTREDLARMDKKRKQKGSNDDWENPRDPYAKITKTKDGRTHFAYKPENAIDLNTGAILAGRSIPQTTTTPRRCPKRWLARGKNLTDSKKTPTRY